ncbi:MAG: aminotransferase class V-fold PLP-dependent enzyme, partial [Planctomycetota bacterium]
AVHAALTGDPGENAARYREAHAAIAAFLDLPAPERLMLTPSCTSALALVLADLPWQPGDAVVTSQLEHHALARPAQRLAAERGVRHVVAPYRPDAPIDLDAVEAALRSGGVRLVAVTGASNITGERLPIAELTALAHAHGAQVLLDAAQLAGLVPLSIAALGVDLVAFTGHKGMLGPLGIGGFWAAPHVAFACPSAGCDVGGDAPPSSPYPGFCDVGSVNLPAAAGLAAALRWLHAREPALRRRPLELAQRLARECRQRPRCHVLGGDGARTATVSMAIDGLPLERAQEHFRDRGVIVRAGQHCAPVALAALGQPAGCVRVSFGADSAADDVDAVLAAIDAVATAPPAG